MTCGSSLEVDIETDFLLSYDHNLSITEIDDMIPWEREVYISLIKQRKQEEKQQGQH